MRIVSHAYTAEGGTALGTLDEHGCGGDGLRSSLWLGHPDPTAHFVHSGAGGDTYRGRTRVPVSGSRRLGRHFIPPAASAGRTHVCTTRIAARTRVVGRAVVGTGCRVSQVAAIGRRRETTFQADFRSDRHRHPVGMPGPWAVRLAGARGTTRARTRPARSRVALRWLGGGASDAGHLGHPRRALRLA